MGATEYDSHVRMASVERVHRCRLFVRHTAHHKEDHVEGAATERLNRRRSTRHTRAEVHKAQRTVEYDEMYCTRTLYECMYSVNVQFTDSFFKSHYEFCSVSIPRFDARNGTGWPLRVAQLALDELVEQHRGDIGLVLCVDVVHALHEKHRVSILNSCIINYNYLTYLYLLLQLPYMTYRVR